MKLGELKRIFMTDITVPNHPNLAIDLDDTLTQNVPFYKTLMENWPGKVYILTGRSPIDEVITLGELKHWGIIKDDHYNQLLMYPENYLYSRHINNGHYMDVDGNEIQLDEICFKIGAWKAKMCQEYGIGVVFDDNPVFVAEMRKNGIYVMHVDGKFGKSC